MEQIPKGIFSVFIVWTVDIYTPLSTKPQWFILLASCQAERWSQRNSWLQH